MKLIATFDDKAFLDALKKIPEIATKELQKGLKSSGAVIVAQARAVHKYKSSSRSGLNKSIQEWIDKDNPLQCNVGFDEKIATYGIYQHDGTRPHKIYAKNKKALYFVKGGVGVVVPKNPHKLPGWMISSGLVGGKSDGKIWSQKGYVDHPGIKPDPFIVEAARVKTPNFVRRMSESVSRIIQKAGFK